MGPSARSKGQSYLHDSLIVMQDVCVWPWPLQSFPSQDKSFVGRVENKINYAFIGNRHFAHPFTKIAKRPLYRKRTVIPSFDPFHASLSASSLSPLLLRRFSSFGGRGLRDRGPSHGGRTDAASKTDLSVRVGVSQRVGCGWTSD